MEIEQIQATATVLEREVAVYVEAVRQELDTMTLNRAAGLMTQVDVLTSLIGKAKADLEKLYDTLRFVTLPGIMTADANNPIKSITINGIGRVVLQDDIRATVPAEFKDEFKDWLVAEGFEDLIQETINAQTLAAFCRRRIREGKEMPTKEVVRDGRAVREGLVKVTPFSRASITKV